MYYMSISAPTDTSPSTKTVPYENFNVMLTFEIIYTNGQLVTTFDVPATFIRTGKIVNMSISPFYIGPTIPNDVYGVIQSLPIGVNLLIRAPYITTPQPPYIPRRCFNYLNTLLPKLIGDIFFYSTDEIPDPTNTKRGVFAIGSTNAEQGGRIELFNRYTSIGFYYSTTAYFSCPYGIDATWITDNEFK